MTAVLSYTLAELVELLQDLGAQLLGPGDVHVSSIREDSRQVHPGCLFVARRGEKSDGTQYVKSAFKQGAVAVLCERGSGVVETPRVEVDRVLPAWARLAQELAGRPSEKMQLVGITGTNGKTTTASLVAQSLQLLGHTTAQIGSLGFFIQEERISDSFTTPQPDEMAAALSLAVARQVQYCVMEVSSHALAQDRVAGLQWMSAGFTNLSQDHLDYHQTMEQYGREKAKLFLQCRPQHSVLITDEPFGRELAQKLDSAWRVSTRPDPTADMEALRVEVSAEGLRARIRVREQEYELSSPLVGRHNLENLLVAWGLLLTLGIKPERALSALARAGRVAGRLERCDTEEDEVRVFVDYAHTPDALQRVLQTLREVTEAPLVCVFGCGGDRDRSKRPLMGQAVAAGADIIWLTSDNPRTENPAQILAEVRAGLQGARGEVHEEENRALAIERAILEAPRGALLLIAGKGHEDYQIVGTQVLPFDDRKQARRALAKRRAVSATKDKIG